MTDVLAPDTLVNERYRILELVGTGGMGAVYKAADSGLGGRIVALKEMSQQGLSADEVAAAATAFQHEARLLASVHHSHLPSIHDYFTAGGQWYLVMDFIDGETLKDYLQLHGAPGLPVAEVLRFAVQVCAVLEYLHAQNPPVIFRDLKPGNIMVTRTGYLYLIDFGIARLFKPGQDHDTVSLGSAGYAAPEQYGKSQTTIRSDIFSFGVVLYQLLTGLDPAVKPFTFPPIQPLNPQVPPQLESLVLWMVQLDESRRPGSIAIVHRELSQITSQFDATQPVVLLPEYQPSALRLATGTVEQRSVPVTYATAPVVKRRGGRCALVGAVLVGLLASLCLGALACSTAGTVLQHLAQSSSTVDAQNTQSAIQYAVSSDVTTLTTDETTLRASVASLVQDSTNLGNVLTYYYTQDWEQMQKDYQQEQQDYQKGCGNLGGNAHLVLADEDSVKSELVNIRSDDVTFTRTQDSVTTDLQQVQKDRGTVQADLQTLEHDALGSYGGGAVTTSESNAQVVLSSSQKQMTTLDQGLKSAQSRVKNYDQEASKTYTAAQNLVNSLHC
jgi:hypothetical protein